MVYSRLCEGLRVVYPILQSGMAGIAGPELVAAVSNAGGLGILAGHTVPTDELRSQIAHTMMLTSKPFGVNLLIPPDLAAPQRPTPNQANRLQQHLNPIREALQLEPREGLPPEPPNDLNEKMEMLLGERIPLLSFGLGSPRPEWIESCRTLGIYTVAMVSTVEDAVRVEEAGVGAVVAQGSEAGGHRSHFAKPGNHHSGAIGTMALVPAVVDVVRIPVIAAGGIVDGRGVAAAFALGADAVMLGTRFVATRESRAVDAYKKAVVDASANDTLITDAASGRYARLMENELLRRLGPSERLPFMWHGSALSDILDRARETNNPEMLALWAGQSCGLIHDLPSAGDVVERIVRETELVLKRLAS